MFKGYVIEKHTTEESSVYASVEFYSTPYALLENMLVHDFLFENGYLLEQFSDKPELVDGINDMYYRYETNPKYNGLIGLIQFVNDFSGFDYLVVRRLIGFLRTLVYRKSKVIKTENEFMKFRNSEEFSSAKTITIYNCEEKSCRLLDSDIISIPEYIEQEFIHAGLSNVREIFKALESSEINTYTEFTGSVSVLARKYGIEDVNSLLCAMEAQMVYGQLGNEAVIHSFQVYLHFLCREYLRKNSSKKCCVF